jgi:hypothetical protein
MGVLIERTKRPPAQSGRERRLSACPVFPAKYGLESLSGFGIPSSIIR